MDKDATQDAKVNCSSFNYARRNDYIHQFLDVNPASEKYKYEPMFRGESLYVHDKNGNRIIDINTGKDKKFTAPKVSNMKQYENDVDIFQKKFKERVQL